MADLALSLALWWGIVFIVALTDSLLGGSRLSIRWFFASFFIGVLGFAGNILGSELFSAPQLVSASQWASAWTSGWSWDWNWGGKIGEVLVALITIAVVAIVSSDARQHGFGFRLRQAEGSIGPSLALIAIMIAGAVAANLAFPDYGDTVSDTAETLIYQATMPGFAEEPIYRGLLLVTLALTIRGTAFTLFGANISWGALLATVLFGFGHGAYVSEGAVKVMWVALIYSAVLGAGLMWIRLRTNSLLFPIVGHNLINVSSSLIGFF